MEFEMRVVFSEDETIEGVKDELCAVEEVDVDIVKQSGIDGSQVVFFFIATGGGAAAITALSSCISKIAVALIKRNDCKSFKIGETEFKGYSEAEAEKILQKIKENPEAFSVKTKKK